MSCHIFRLADWLHSSPCWLGPICWLWDKAYDALPDDDDKEEEVLKW